MQLLAHLTVTPTPIPGSLAYTWEHERLLFIVNIGLILAFICLILVLLWGLKRGFTSGSRNDVRIIYSYRIGGNKKKRNYHTCSSRHHKRRR